MTTRLRRIPLAAVVVALAAGAPFFVTELELFTAARIVIVALWATSLNLLLGGTGLVSFAHAAYFGVGAYSVALVWLHLGWSPLVGLVAAPFIGGFVSFVTGAFALRATHLYFSLLTLALSQLLFAVAFQWYSVTGGDNGIHGIEVPSVLDSTVTAYWFVLALAAGGIAGLRIISRSPFGAALLAIRENRLRASFLGIDVKRYELAAFTIAGAFAALAGALFGMFNREAYPNLMFWTENAQPIFVTLIGGMYSFFGPLIGAVVYILLDEAVARRTLYSGLVLGPVLLLIVVLVPGGITELAGRLRARFGRRKEDASAPAARRADAVREPDEVHS